MNEALSSLSNWEKLSPQFNFLRQFSGIEQHIKLVEQKGEFVPSPEYPIHFVGITQIPDQPVETGFSLSQSDEDNCAGIIIMNHENEVHPSTGISGCKYYKGRMLSKDGWDIGMFSKYNNPHARDPGIVTTEIDSYRALEKMSIEKPEYLSPHFSTNQDELIMVDLKNLGYSDNTFRRGIQDMSLPIQRRLFFQVLKAYSTINLAFFKDGKYPSDLIIHGKGIWVKIKEDENVQIVLSDFGNVNDLPEDSNEKIVQSLSNFMQNLTGTDDDVEDDISFLEQFPFLSVDTHHQTISSTDPLIASIGDKDESLIGLLNDLYQGNFDRVNNPPNAILRLLIQNKDIDYDQEFTHEPFSLDLILKDIATDPKQIFKNTYLLQLANRTGLQPEELIAQIHALLPKKEIDD